MAFLNLKLFYISRFFFFVLSYNFQVNNPLYFFQTEKAMEEEAKLSKILTKDLQEKGHLVIIFRYRLVHIIYYNLL